MHVAIIGGAGTIGSTAAFSLTSRNTNVDVTLVDVAQAKHGHATDLTHANCHVANPAGSVTAATDGTGTIETADLESDAVEDADCIVVTASTSRPEGGAQRGGRMHFLEGNRRIAEEIGDRLQSIEPRPLICVTNPLDRITHRLWTASGWPRQSVLGYSLSETARLADWLAQWADADPAAVSCPVLGEHGERIVPAFSRATIDGDPISISAEEREAAIEFVLDAPYDVIDARGPAESSRWVTGRGVALLAEAVLRDEVVDPICLSVPLEGEYGIEDVCLSVPVTLSADGWDRIHEWELSAWESNRLATAGDAVSKSL